MLFVDDFDNFRYHEMQFKTEDEHLPNKSKQYWQAKTPSKPNPDSTPPQPSFPSHPSSETPTDTISQHSPSPVTNLTSTFVSDTTLAVFIETDTQPLSVPNPASN
jgi:hypothetical protein